MKNFHENLNLFVSVECGMNYNISQINLDLKGP